MTLNDMCRCCGEQGNSVCKIREQCARFKHPGGQRTPRVMKLCDNRFLMYIRDDENKEE